MEKNDCKLKTWFKFCLIYSCHQTGTIRSLPQARYPGQGPVNLRCVKAVDTEFAWIDADDESDTDDGETVVIESESEKLPTCFLTTPEYSEAENNPRVSVCINSRPNTLINNSNSSIPVSAIEGQGDTLYLATKQS